MRRCAIGSRKWTSLLQFIYLQVPTGLGKGESPELNLASLSKGAQTINSVLVNPQGIALMVKAALLECFLVVASREGLRHSDDRSYQRIATPYDDGYTIDERCERVTVSNKPGNGKPKRAAYEPIELRDRLRRGASLYGDGVFIIN